MKSKQTFYKRAYQRFKARAADSYANGLEWFRHSYDYVGDINNDINKWVKQHRKSVITFIGLLVFVAVTILFIIEASKGKMENSTKIGVGGIIGAPLVGGLVGAIGALLIYISLWLIDRLFLVFIYVAMLIPIAFLASLYAIYLVLMVIVQFLLLIPLTLFVLVNKMRLLWRHIFYTCPNRECSYRGLPTYVCPNHKCGQDHNDLVPNKYGLFYHICSCGMKLPTFDLWGRKKLVRRCSQCQITLSGGIGLHPEELVALIGGTSVGKTAFLLDSTRELISGTVKITRNGIRNGNNHNILAKIAVPSQEKDLKIKLEAMKNGLPPDKTDMGHKNAYLLRLNRGGKESLLYYYDAAGETFSKITRAGKLQHLKHLDGILLLVDPYSLDNLKHLAYEETFRYRASDMPFLHVVSHLIAGVKNFCGKNNRKCIIPLAVIITKADTPAVKEILGNVEASMPTSEQCQYALDRWGAGNEVRSLLQAFSTIRFFACSALGRSPRSGDNRPLNGYRTKEPLQWILNK